MGYRGGTRDGQQALGDPIDAVHVQLDEEEEAQVEDDNDEAYDDDEYNHE